MTLERLQQLREYVELHYHPKGASDRLTNRQLAEAGFHDRRELDTLWVLGYIKRTKRILEDPALPDYIRESYEQGIERHTLELEALI